MKRPFTLMEVLLAFGIGAMLLGYLLFTYTTQIRFEQRFEKSKEEVLTRAYIRSRLNTLFQNGYAWDYDEEEERLEFSYDAGVDPNIELSDLVTGELFVDEKGRLSFRAKKPDGEVERVEVLEKGVSNLTVSFLGEDRISLIKVTYNQGGKNLTYAFQVATYPEGVIAFQ